MVNKIISFIVGWIRYYLYYNRDGSFIREHILEQIDLRIKSMNQFCYMNGSCKECGCATTALQMANKACEGKCYPKMLNKRKWKQFKDNNIIVVEDITWVLNEELKFQMIEEDEV